MTKIDLEQAKMLKELFGGPSSTQPAVPVISVPQDRDSFASTRSALKDNWIFLVALFGTGMWVMNAVNDGQTVNINQQNEIDRNTAAIVELKDIATSGQTNTADIIRRLDNLQKDLEVIKAAQ